MTASLQKLALQVCSLLPENTFVKRGKDDLVHLKEEAFLPASLCEPLLLAMVESRPLRYISIFTDKERCQLTKLNLSSQKLNAHQDIIKALLEHNLEEIDLSDSYLDEESANKLGECGKNLQVLSLSGTKGNWTSKGAKFLQKLGSVTKLDVSRISAPFGSCIKSISTLKNLVWLDMSSTELGSILPLKNISGSLKLLYLYDACQRIDNYVRELNDVIPQMKSLTHLDISKRCPAEGSRSQNESHFAMHPYLDGKLLEKIATLPDLVYLDISGCEGLKEEDLDTFTKKLSRKLQFFGLFGTNLESFSNIPAEQITGIHNEEQVLISMALYEKRMTYIIRALQSLFAFLSDGVVKSLSKILQVTISSAKIHIKDDQAQLMSSGCLYLILHHDGAADLGSELRRSAVSYLLDIMEAHNQAPIFLQNCLQCLCCFNIPEELEFEALRCCKKMLQILRPHRGRNICLVAMMILNALICHTSIKMELGQMGAVKIILDIIHYNFREGVVDELLDTCWCTLWNITDETPENCEDFISNGGMTLFKNCVKEFQGENDLQRSILGLMGNIAEVPSLRCKMLEDDAIALFINMLDSNSFHLEICYNAAGVLSHICSDGDAAWTLKSISRNDCMKRVTASVAKWNVGASRNINYRSLQPILRLLPLDFNPCGQEWAVWALANLTNVNPEKYCTLLVSEGGIDLLSHILNSHTSTFSMKKYADMTLKRVAGFGNEANDVDEDYVIVEEQI